MYPSNNLIVTIDTTNAVTIPTARIIISFPLKLKPNPTSFKKLAPNITGILRKNENSAATNLDVPNNIAPRIVAPDLDVPGIKAKT